MDLDWYNMNSLLNLSNEETQFIKEAFLNVSKYSSGEVIVTDEKFNILFQNTKYITNKQNFNFLNLDKNFITENFKNIIKNFNISEKNHIYIKMIFNEEGNFNNIPVDVHICKIKNKDKILKGFVIIIQDITEEIRNRIQRETFIDIISHDLRNPIRANIQVLELILNNKFGELENNLKVILDELLGSCRFINYMAENLLIKYKNEFNMYELNKQNYSIIKLIKDKCNSLLSMLNRKNQTIEFVVSGKINDISMDVSAIGNVVNNLIVNASEQSCENSKIIIQVEKNKNNVKVSFIDTGNISNISNPNDIFEEYFMCSNRFRKIGFGLEFYNCRKIIEAHNGSIIAKNVKNKGNAIIFSLPLFN